MVILVLPVFGAVDTLFLAATVLREVAVPEDTPP
jgi:hypothetical protein